MQKKIRMLILAVIFLFAFCLVRDFLIKSLIGNVASKITGTPVRIGGLSLSVIRQSIRISNFRMYNPEGFPKGILADIPSMNVACNLGALITGKIHLKQLGLEIREINMVKNKEGNLNVDSLKVTKGKPGKKEKKPAKQLALRIDTLNLGMGRVVSKDYSVEGQPVVKVYNINLNKTYKNISSAQQLVILMISEPLKAAGIQGLKVYGASLLSGMGALPVAVALNFIGNIGKDYVQETFDVAVQRAYDAGLQAIKMTGKVRTEDKAGGVINAEVDGARVTLKLKELSARSTQVTISARKFGLPQPAIASEIMYRLSEKLK